MPGIGFTTAPFAVTELLIRAYLPLPLAEPKLPEEVTHVSVVPMRDGSVGCYWDPALGWSPVRTPSAPGAQHLPGRRVGTATGLERLRRERIISPS